MTDAAPSRIDSLTSWRGIFAICIVLFHCKVVEFTEPTKFGVTFFFVVSGFLLGIKHRAEEVRGKRYFKFIGLRALRLYTYHWVTLAIFIALAVGLAHGKGINWDAFVPNLFFAQIFSADKDVVFSFNGHMWFLGDLLLCYAIYPLLGMALGKFTLRNQLLGVGVVMALMWVVMGCCVPHDMLTCSYVFPPVRIFEFMVGMVLGQCYLAIREKSLGWSDTKVSAFWLVTIIAIVLLFALVRMGDGTIVDHFNEFVLWEIPVCALVILSALTAGRTDMMSRAITSTPLMWLGKLSLEIYILQAIAGQIYAYLVSPLFGHFGLIIYHLYPVGIFFILLPLSWFTHRYFSAPFSAWIARTFA